MSLRIKRLKSRWHHGWASLHYRTAQDLLEESKRHALVDNNYESEVYLDRAYKELGKYKERVESLENLLSKA